MGKFEIEKKITELLTRNNNSNASDLLEKVSIWHILIFKTIVMAIIIYVCFMPLILSFQDKKIMEKANKVEQAQPSTYRILNNEKQTSEGFEDLRINPMSDYDYLSKKEVYDIRKKYVSESVWANDNYEPSEEVFGQIADNKPWWGDMRCDIMDYKGDYHEHIEGDSMVSVQMNNPNALVGIGLPYIPWDDPYYGEFCTSEYSKFIPYSIKYNEKDKLFVTTYKILPELTTFGVWIGKENRFLPLELSGLNARDFGYNYVWAVDTKNIKMFNSGNVVENVQTFQDYIHLGGSCKYKDGCNNISPMQNGLLFNVKGLPAEIDLKLWKKHPSNKYSKADVYYIIRFEE